MGDPQTLGRTSLAAARRRALLPRRALLVAAALLSLLGLRALLSPAPAPVVQQLRATGPVAATDRTTGFAEAFARAYLTWDVDRPEQHAVALAPYLGPDIDIDAGLPVPTQTSDQTVTWTAVVDQVTTDARRVVVTVAVALAGDPALRHLAVPVSTGPTGELAVTDYPAVVARPRLGDQLAGRSGDELADNALRAVVERALGNYLSQQAENLQADLAAGADLRVPKPAMTLDDLVSVQWAGRARGRVSAVVVARDQADVAYTLRYELRVVREGRWYVAEINPPMARKESIQ